VNVNKLPPLVYVVDDEFVIRDSLTLFIESTGLKVRSFESAEDFLSNYGSEQPGCLVLDVTMPLMSGLELQNELLNRGIHIPIIFISGSTETHFSKEVFRAGATDVLKKPFNNNLLLERINEAIKRDLAFRGGGKKRLIQA